MALQAQQGSNTREGQRTCSPTEALATLSSAPLSFSSMRLSLRLAAEAFLFCVAQSISAQALPGTAHAAERSERVVWTKQGDQRARRHDELRCSHHELSSILTPGPALSRSMMHMHMPGTVLRQSHRHPGMVSYHLQCLLSLRCRPPAFLLLLDILCATSCNQSGNAHWQANL